MGGFHPYSKFFCQKNSMHEHTPITQIYTHTYLTHTRTHTHAHTCTHACTHAHTQAHTHTHTCTHTHTLHGPPGCVEMPVEKTESSELGFELRVGGQIPQTGRQWIPNRWRNENDTSLANRFETAFRDFPTFLAQGSEGVRSLTCAERSCKVRRMCTIKWRSARVAILYSQQNFTGSQRSSRSYFQFFKTSQAALFWTLCGQSICFCRQTSWDWVAVIKAGGNQSGR